MTTTVRLIYNIEMVSEMGLFITITLGVKEMIATALYYYEREERMNTQGVSLASVAQIMQNAEQTSQVTQVTGARL